jgi:hypothetical protein
MDGGITIVAGERVVDVDTGVEGVGVWVSGFIEEKALVVGKDLELSVVGEERSVGEE